MQIESMLLIVLMFRSLLVDSANINTKINRSVAPIHKGTNNEERFTELCFLCGRHGTTVPEEIKSRNLSHLFNGEVASLSLKKTMYPYQIIN